MKTYECVNYGKIYCEIDCEFCNHVPSVSKSESRKLDVAFDKAFEGGFYGGNG